MGKFFYPGDRSLGIVIEIFWSKIVNLSPFWLLNHSGGKIYFFLLEEKGMKKVMKVLLVLSLVVALVGGCFSAPAQNSAGDSVAGPETSAPANPVDMNIVALKGPTAMGMVQFMNAVDEGTIADNNYNFSIVAAVDEVTPKIVQGQADIAAVPANLASVLYNNTKGGVQVLAVNTLGVLYIVERGDTVKSVDDLKGKTIFASGKGATPEYALNYILEENGLLDAVNIEWKSEHTECVAALTANENAIAMLPQPFVTTAQSKDSNIRIALDLTKEWDKLQAGATEPSALITGVVVARTEFVKEHPEAVAAFMEHYQASVEFVNANTQEAANLIEKYDIVPAAVAVKALPYCNITFIEGAEMKDKLGGYLGVLFEQNPKSVGGALPGDEFYYSR